MEIAVIPAGTANLTNKEIETAVQALGFEITGVVGNADTDTIEELLTAIIGNMEINIQKQDGSNTESVIQSLSVRDLAEICVHNDGVVTVTKIDGTHVTLNFTLEVCNDAALQLSDNAKLMLAISGIPVATDVKIDGLDHPAATHSYIKYEAKFVNENVGKDFNIDQHYALAVPVDNIKALELTYKNGKNVKLSKREVKQLLRDAQDSIYNRNGLVTYGFYKWAVLSVEEVVVARVTLDASTNFYLLKNQSI